ncbi:MAG TPA: J domain-containing protein, partial [Ramlibacter sp.]|nr:J domain-containing protein [Ramlibacter sp.]
MEFNPAARRSAIEGALREYQRTPGKHAQGQRQPSLLFAWINEILLLASGRSIDGEKGRLPDAALQQCACFFVLRALLFPGADHYSLLGLDRHADAGEIKNRYRQMMRLLHPDFAGSSGVAKWPADAATRVNQAYEVLSSSVQRRSYDEQFETEPVRSAPAAGQAGPARIMPAHPHARARAAIEDPRRRLKRLATAFGAAGGLVLVAAWMANAPSDKASLVQRADVASRPVVAAAPVPVSSPAPPALDPAPAAATEPPLALLVPAPVVTEPSPSVPLVPARSPVHATPQPAAMPVAAQATAGRAATSAMSAPAATNVPQPEPVAVAPVIAAPPAPAVAEPASPSPTLADVHPLIAKLLQEMESGYG